MNKISKTNSLYNLFNVFFITEFSKKIGYGHVSRIGAMSSVMALKGFNCKIFVIGETKYKEDILKLNQDTNVLYKFMKSSYSIIPHLKLTYIFFDLIESIKYL